MTLSEKLKRLTMGRSRAAVARAAGISPTVFASYVNRGSEPGITTARRIARVLDVPLEWLADDDTDFPPPTNKSAEVLALELGAIMRPVALKLLEAVAKAQSVNWIEVIETLLKLRASDPIPALVHDAAAIYREYKEQSQAIGQFDPICSAGEHFHPKYTSLFKSRRGMMSLLDVVTVTRMWVRAEIPGFEEAGFLMAEPSELNDGFRAYVVKQLPALRREHEAMLKARRGSPVRTRRVGKSSQEPRPLSLPLPEPRRKGRTREKSR